MQDQLHYKDEELHSLETQQSRHHREGSAREVNLDQALTHVKQTCTHLTEENDCLKKKEYELLSKLESLECEKDILQKKISEASRPREESKQTFCASGSSGPPRACATFLKPIPEESEVDTLLHENSKLKQELQCLQTNFQITSSKTVQMKKELKYLEKTLAELQTQHDHVLDEKEELKKKFEEAQTMSTTNPGLKHTETEKNEQLRMEIASLQDKLQSFQSQNLDLQVKLRKEFQRSLEAQDTIRSLGTQLNVLINEKARTENELVLSQTKLQEVQDELSSLVAVQSQHSYLEQKASEAVAGYKHKVASLKFEKQELKDQLDMVSRSLDDAVSKMQGLEEREASLLKMVASLEARNVTLTVWTKDQTHLPNEIHELHTKPAGFSEKVEPLKIEKGTLKEVKERTDAQIRELSSCNKKLSEEAACNCELTKQLQKELERMETVVFEFKESSKEKEKEYTRQTGQIEDLKLKLFSTESQKSMFEAEVGKLLRRLDELEQCSFELSIKLSDIETESHSAKFSKSKSQARLVGLENRLHLLEGALLERDSIISDLKCASELMESENSTLVSQVTSLSEMVAARNCKVDNLNSQLSMYEFETRDIVEKVAELETSHSQCGTIQKDLECEVCRLKESLELVQSAEKEAESAILLLRLKVKELQESNASLEAIITHIEKDRKLTITQSEEIATLNTTLESCINSMKQELSNKDASLRAAQKEAEFLRKSKDVAEVSLKTEVECLEEKCTELTTQLDTAEQRKVELASRVTELEIELAEEKHKTSTVLAEKDSTSKQLDFLHTELNTVKDQLVLAKAELRSTKTALNYQEQKLSEAEKEKKMIQGECDTITEQYRMLRESALSMLEQSAPHKDENVMAHPKSNKLKGILKNPEKENVLKPVVNIP